MVNVKEKKKGRPKTKQGKKVTFYLSFDIIKKIRTLTQLTRNASELVERLINQEYYKFDNGQKKREGLGEA